jgi:hypothetical protein
MREAIGGFVGVFAGAIITTGSNYWLEDYKFVRPVLEGKPQGPPRASPGNLKRRSLKDQLRGGRTINAPRRVPLNRAPQSK